ncbi:DUF1648 domain-containing protein [Winogradskyella immobilis]|uniref:DUF1648 domain-containing protein n=1 Tax=Winogradskyella immobilis TaxID=2816852 RepID=A0ABS8EMR6_9FLAO|nr:DUF1648 domain-containing protein [Winogradskyella immobilis]MCC1484509.1 DUF1648 domain-containing protein [Winogradskyella immobilis]MCG0016601.1 DUF1648 domain-containing protein [Winogradskyella immobilis]
MNNNRPKIKIPLQTIDIAIELVSITLLILMWLHVILEYNNLPDTIASHFNSSGQLDNYSSKLFVWLMPCLATLMYGGLFYLNRFPHLYNYMVNITEHNAFKHYQFSTRVLRIVNMLCMLLLAYISYHIITVAENESTSLGNGFLFTVIGFSILLPVVLLIYQKKLNKTEKH